MKKCFLFHDYETVYKTKEIEQAVTGYLVLKGFTKRKNGTGCSYMGKDMTFDFSLPVLDYNNYPVKPNYEIRLFWYLIESNDLDRCIGEPKEKVCIKCGYIKKNYSMEQILKRVDEYIREETEQLERRARAEYYLSKNKN